MHDFTAQVYRYIEALPEGKITTYARIANALGHPGAARAIGTALAKYVFWETGNCYRVVRSDGFVGGYCGSLDNTKILEKKRKLERIGCSISASGKIKNFQDMVL